MTTDLNTSTEDEHFFFAADLRTLTELISFLGTAALEVGKNPDLSRVEIMRSFMTVAEHLKGIRASIRMYQAVSGGVHSSPVSEADHQAQPDQQDGLCDDQTSSRNDD